MPLIRNVRSYVIEIVSNFLWMHDVHFKRYCSVGVIIDVQTIKMSFPMVAGMVNIQISADDSVTKIVPCGNLIV
mgnify:CR=1 FL=1